MRIVPYDSKYKDIFIEMNLAWIRDMFAVESEDERELRDIEPALQRGGQIFFAIADDDSVMACCMIAPREAGNWEILKFAARRMYRGIGAGDACLKACIDYARQRGIPKIEIVSNTKCHAALHLYRKNGFTEIPVDKEKYPFERANIAFELVL